MNIDPIEDNARYLKRVAEGAMVVEPIRQKLSGTSSVVGWDSGETFLGTEGGSATSREKLSGKDTEVYNGSLFAASIVYLFLYLKMG